MNRENSRSQDKTIEGETMVAERNACSRSPGFDLDTYRHHLDDCEDLTEEQANELLRTLWDIMCAFVDLGFGLHPVQEVTKSCGQAGEDERKAPEAGPREIEYGDQSITEEFAGPAGTSIDRGARKEKT